MSTASNNRKTYSQSVRLRRVAHQVLTSEECQTFKEALKVFREKKTPEQLVNDLELILDSPKKLNLLWEIVLLLPEPQRPEFIVRCRNRLKGADLLLQESFIAAEFEQRFGKKMAALSIAPEVDEGGGGRRASLSDYGRRSSAAPDGLETPTEAARRPRSTDERSLQAKITLADAAKIRRLSDDRASSVIKLKSATFQVRYRSKLPLQFESLPEEAARESPGTTDGGSEDDGSDSCPSDFEYAKYGRARAPLSDLRDKGFWALHSPRRALEERRKLQQQQQRRRRHEDATAALQDSDSASPERREDRHRGHRQHHRQAAAAAAAAATAVTAAAAAAAPKEAAELKSAEHGNGAATTADEAADHSPVPELRTSVAGAPRSPSDSHIYKLLYAPSAARAEDQMSLTSSMLESEFLKTRHVQSQMTDLARDFDATPASPEDRRLLLTAPQMNAKTDQGVQCDIGADTASGNFVPFPATYHHQVQGQLPQQPPPFGFYFIPMPAPYPGSHLLHHSMAVASPLAGGSYFPWSQFWSSMAQPQHQHMQQQQFIHLSRPAAMQRVHQQQQQQGHQSAEGCLRHVTLRKSHAGGVNSSFGLSIGHVAPEEPMRVQRSPFIVTTVETGSPAHCQGIQPGDQLMELEGEPVFNMSLHQLGLAVRSRDCIRLCLLSGGGQLIMQEESGGAANSASNNACSYD